VLEPGCGAGTFLGLAPAAATELIGVELDPTTAAIAAALYPQADIRAESFAATRLPVGSVELTVGNAPVRQDRPARPGVQRRRAQPAQPLHPQSAAADPVPPSPPPNSPARRAPALDRADTAGLDVPAALTELTCGLPDQHPARALRY